MRPPPASPTPLHAPSAHNSTPRALSSPPPPVRYLKLLLTALHKIPPSAITLFRGVAKALAQLSQKFETGKPVVWWPVTSTASRVDVLSNPVFMGSSGPRCLFAITAVSARDIQRYSAMGSQEREYVLLPGSCFKVDAILDAGSGLTIVQLTEDPSLDLLNFHPSHGQQKLAVVDRPPPSKGSSATSQSSQMGKHSAAAAQPLGRYSLPNKHVVSSQHTTPAPRNCNCNCNCNCCLLTRRPPVSFTQDLYTRRPTCTTSTTAGTSGR